jgi:hypothetical protein
MSKIKTTTSTTRPTDAETGELFFETDTNRLIFWDGNIWHVYMRDSITSTTGGIEELHYDTGIWSDQQNANYIPQSPVMHFDSTRVGSIESEYYGEDKVIDSTVGPFGWVNIASPGVKDIFFSGYTAGTKIIDKGSGVQGVTFQQGSYSLANGTDQSQYTTGNDITSFDRGLLDPVTLVWLAKRTGLTLHPVAWSSTMFGSFAGNNWQSYAPLGGGSISINNIADQAGWDDLHGKFGSDYILQIARHDGGTGAAEWYVNGDTYTFNKGVSIIQSPSIITGTQETENYEMLAFDHSLDNVDINKVVSYLNNKYSMTQPDWS